MKQKKLLLALSAMVITVALFALFRWLRPIQELPPATTIAGANPPPASVPKQNTIKSKDFPASAQEEIQKCLGTPAGSFFELEALIAAAAGESKSDQLEWKVVQFEDEAGQAFRVRLAREFSEAGKPRLTLNLFRVDAEGLPDRVSLPPSETLNPDLAALDRVLHNKRIGSEIESQRYLYPHEKELTTERENGEIRKLQYAGGKIRLSCEATAEEPACHCVQ